MSDMLPSVAVPAQPDPVNKTFECMPGWTWTCHTAPTGDDFYKLFARYAIDNAIASGLNPAAP